MRADGGIPPLVALLDAADVKVQRAGAGALRTLAFKNEENKKQAVECGALPLLIQVCVRVLCLLGTFFCKPVASGHHLWQASHTVDLS